MNRRMSIMLSLLILLLSVSFTSTARDGDVMQRYTQTTKEMRPTNSYGTYRFHDFAKVMGRLAGEDNRKRAETLNKMSSSGTYIPCPVIGSDAWGFVKIPEDLTGDGYGFLLSNSMIQIVTMAGAKTVETTGIMKGNAGEYRTVLITPAEHIVE